MVEIDKAKAQKPKIELVNQSKGQLKFVANQIKIDPNQIKINPSDLEIKLCDPFYERLCNIEICTPDIIQQIPVCGPDEVTIPDRGDEVTLPAINSSEELVTAVKSLTYEVQELKKKIGK